jgi:phosphoglucomutase
LKALNRQYFFVNAVPLVIINSFNIDSLSHILTNKTKTIVRIENKMKIATNAYNDQKAGTSGLRKKVSVFQQINYLENYVQSIFDCLQDKQGKTLIIGGDGRFYNKQAVQIIIKMAAANGFSKLIIGQNGLLSTPAASHLIRHNKAYGGIILSASHNPGGENGDFGIKYNISNGGPAPEKLTDAIYERTKIVDKYFTIDSDEIDLSAIGSSKLGDMEIKIINPVADYANLMSEIFDFDAIRAMLQNGFEICFDAMHAVNGPYAKMVLQDMLGAPNNALMNCEPSPNFGGHHPDPNLVHARQLYDLMMSNNAPDFGAATDGDGDRNLIIGKGIFVTPSDSLAILAANLHLIRGYKNGIKGIARSMPTSMAADRVADALGVPIYETPTGWKFFGNLLDDERITICGEESAGTGSNHVREKDGLWAVLAWLNIIAIKKQSVKQIVNEHWEKFGRNYYTRHDYEEIELDKANKLMKRLNEKLDSLVGQQVSKMKISKSDNFSYLDPVDGSLSKNQGIRIIFENDSRIIIRMSGTGTIGATIRIYIEKFEPANGEILLETQKALARLITAAKILTDIEAITGREEPNVVT